MNLNDFFGLISPDLGVDAPTLAAYAAEDAIGGFHPDEAQRQWTVGSLWEVEGKALYALTRALRPSRVLEIGTHTGCSATHILAALEANGKGKLLSLDQWAGAGEGIPEALRKRWEFVADEAAAYLRSHKVKAELVYEDALHDPDGTRAILNAIKDSMSPRLILSHDAEHFLVGADVRGAWREVYGDGGFHTALIEPSDCGLAWRIQA